MEKTMLKQQSFLSYKTTIITTLILLGIINLTVGNDATKEVEGKLSTIISSTVKRSIQVQDDKFTKDYDEDESEQEDVDEYEEELKNIAESHEAMSRDEIKNTTDGSDINIFSKIHDTKNFDSKEKTLEENETISNEYNNNKTKIDDIKYKRNEKQSNKRVPTIKKELRLQKEIHQENDTKNSTPIARTINQFHGEFLFNKSQEKLKDENGDDDDANDDDDDDDDEYIGIESAQDLIKRQHKDFNLHSQMFDKVNKKQQSDLKGFKAYLPPSNTLELEKQHQLQKVGMEEYLLAESLMELFVKLAANPKRWEWAHKLLNGMKNNLELFEQSELDNKRDYDMNYQDLTSYSPLIEKVKPMSNKAKKKKKKKKNPIRNQLSSTSIPLSSMTQMAISSESTTTTTTAAAATKSTSISTSKAPALEDEEEEDEVLVKAEQTNWQYPQNHGEQLLSPNLSKISYSISSKQYSPSAVSNYHDENVEYSIPTSNAIRKLPLSRNFHKINTHDKDSLLSQYNFELPVYKVNSVPVSSNAQPIDYDIPRRVYQKPRIMYGQRYDQFKPYDDRQKNMKNRGNEEAVEDVEINGDDRDEREGVMRKEAELQGEKHLTYFSGNSNSNNNNNEFIYPHDYYDKAWKYSDYDRARVDPVYSNKWNTRYRQWRPMFDDENKNERRIYGKFTTWSNDKNKNRSAWRLLDQSKSSENYNKNKNINNDDDGGGKDNKSNRYNIGNNKNHSAELNEILPKITLKTWNSLTSDPATWPFKLSSIKPWPKDKNGKSYNPNADLVRKLGLDKQSRLLDTKNINNNNKNLIKDSNNNNSNNKSNKIQSKDNWTVEQSNWKNYNQQSGSESRWDDIPWQRKLTDWNVDFGKESSHSATWPPKWKQFSYHKVQTGPINKAGGSSSSSSASSTLSSASSDSALRSRNNAYIAVSAVSSSSNNYNDNEWRKNDIEEMANDSFDDNENNPTSQLLFNQKFNKNKNNINHYNKTDDILENQLEQLQQNNLEKRSLSTEATYFSLNTTTNRQKKGTN